MDSDPYAPPADAASADEAAMQNHGDVSPDDLRCPAVVVNMRILYTALGLAHVWLAISSREFSPSLIRELLPFGLMLVPPAVSLVRPRTSLAWWVGVAGGLLACHVSVSFFAGVFSPAFPEEMETAAPLAEGRMDIFSFISLVFAFLHVRLIWVSVAFMFSARSRRWHRAGKYRRPSAAAGE